MSKKSLFDQPGIEKMLPNAELPVGVKVTGRNLGAVSLLASVSGESLGIRTVVSAFFETDGSLSHVKLSDESGDYEAKAGQYVLLGDDKKYIVIMDKSDFEFFKVLVPLSVAVDKAADTILTDVFGL